MRQWNLIKLLVQAVALSVCSMALTGCSISDDDRCVDGMQWDDDYKSCVVAEPGDSDDADSQSDSAATADSDAQFSACTGAADCSTDPTDYCLLDPTHPDQPGICTIDECTTGSCPAGSLCCDCSGNPLIPFESALCIPGSQTSQLTTYGCTCD